jgi:hypothetical protein
MCTFALIHLRHVWILSSFLYGGNQERDHKVALTGRERYLSTSKNSAPVNAGIKIWARTDAPVILSSSSSSSAVSAGTAFTVARRVAFVFSPLSFCSSFRFSLSSGYFLPHSPSPLGVHHPSSSTPSTPLCFCFEFLSSPSPCVTPCVRQHSPRQPR